jgi:hypothetical protein
MKKNVENKLIKELAKEFEFNVCKITDAILPLSAALRLKEFIDPSISFPHESLNQ